MRAAIFASLVPAPKSEEQRKRLEDLIAIIVDWDQVKHGNSAKIREAQELIWQAFPDGPPRLIDPFMRPCAWAARPTPWSSTRPPI